MTRGCGRVQTPGARPDVRTQTADGGLGQDSYSSPCAYMGTIHALDVTVTLGTREGTFRGVDLHPILPTHVHRSHRIPHFLLHSFASSQDLVGWCSVFFPSGSSSISFVFFCLFRL